jgi:hypothetical protein
MPFSPSDISGLKIWLKADAGAGSSDGDLVGTWSDQSGGAHNFTAAGSARPTYKTNIRNGLPVVRFDGSDDELAGGDLSALFSTGASVFAAVSSSNSQFVVYEHGQIDMWWSFSGAGYWGPFRSARLASTPGSGLPTSSGWHMWSMTADNGSNYKMWLDTVSQINDTGGFTFSGGTQHRIGRQHPNGTYTAMDLGELIVYDSALSGTDRASVESYLNDRWIAGNATASPSLTAGIGAVPAPTASGAATTTPSAVAGIGDVPAPTAFSTSGGTAVPQVTPGVGSVPAAVASGQATATPSASAGVGAVPSPTASGAAKATPSTVAGIGAVLQVRIDGTGHPVVVAAIGHVPHAVAVGGGTGGGGGSVDGVNDFWVIKALG